MQRHVQLVKLLPERHQHYLDLHASVWPQVEERIRASNLVNYSIHVHGELLIAYFEYTGEDFDADMARIAADPVTQKWWELTLPCQSPLPGGAPWVEASEVWHLG
jgi:L-rhamnose mutarotase